MKRETITLIIGTVVLIANPTFATDNEDHMASEGVPGITHHNPIQASYEDFEHAQRHLSATLTEMEKRHPEVLFKRYTILEKFHSIKRSLLPEQFQATKDSWWPKSPYSELPERFCAQVKGFRKEDWSEVLEDAFKFMPKEERYNVAAWTILCFELKPELRYIGGLFTIFAFENVKDRLGLFNFLTKNTVKHWTLWDLSKLKEDSGFTEWESIFKHISSSHKESSSICLEEPEKGKNEETPARLRKLNDKLWDTSSDELDDLKFLKDIPRVQYIFSNSESISDRPKQFSYPPKIRFFSEDKQY